MYKFVYDTLYTGASRICILIPYKLLYSNIYVCPRTDTIL